MLGRLFKKSGSKFTIALAQVRFVVFDTETTGFNYATDRILSIGAVEVKDNRMNLKNSFEVFLEQEKFNPESVQIHGIIKHHKYKKISEKQAMEEFSAYIKDAVLVGHHVGYDIKMLNAALQRNDMPNLNNKFIDTNYLFKKTKIINILLQNDYNYSLDDICVDLNITPHDRHSAAGDAFLTALAFLKLLGKLSRNKTITTLESLLKL